MMLLKICFFYNPTFYALELRKDKSTEYVLSWKSKAVYTPKLTILYTVFLYSVKFGYKLRKKINKEPLVAEQSNTSKILNAHIVSDLDTWPNNLYRKFLRKNCLFGATIITKK